MIVQEYVEISVNSKNYKSLLENGYHFIKIKDTIFLMDQLMLIMDFCKLIVLILFLLIMLPWVEGYIHFKLRSLLTIQIIFITIVQLNMEGLYNVYKVTLQ